MAFLSVTRQKLVEKIAQSIKKQIGDQSVVDIASIDRLQNASHYVDHLDNSSDPELYHSISNRCFQILDPISFDLLFF